MLCVRIVSLDLFTIQDGSPGIQSPVTAEESGRDHNIITLTNGRGHDPQITQADSMFAVFRTDQTTCDPKHKKQKVNYSPVTAEDSGQDHNIISLTNGQGHDPKVNTLP